MEAMKGTGGEMPPAEEMAKLTAAAGLDENGDLLEDGSFGGGGPGSSNDGDGGSIAGGSDCGSTSPVPPSRSPPSSWGTSRGWTRSAAGVAVQVRMPCVCKAGSRLRLITSRSRSG